MKENNNNRNRDDNNNNFNTIFEQIMANFLDDFPGLDFNFNTHFGPEEGKDRGRGRNKNRRMNIGDSNIDVQGFRIVDVPGEPTKVETFGMDGTEKDPMGRKEERKRSQSTRQHRNQRQGRQRDQYKDEKEENKPFSEIIEEDEKVRVIMDVPRADKDLLDINIDDGKLFVNVHTEQETHREEFELPTDVESEPIEKKYNNGILEIIFVKK